jgi:excisionase family DNA binding protein
MTMLPTQSLAQKLDALSQETVLECLAYIHKRRAHIDQLERLLQARLAQLTSPPATHQNDELLTADEVAARLKLSRARVYELVRACRLAKVQFGKQIRIPSHALDSAGPTDDLTSGR